MAIYFGQTIAEKLVQADAYYDERSIYKHDWNKLSDGDKKLALLNSEDRVNAYLGINLEEMYDETDWPEDNNPNFRPDYAIFVDAYFILDNTATTKDGTDGVKRIESESYQEEERASGVPIAPDATRYLRMNRLQVCRG